MDTLATSGIHQRLFQAMQEAMALIHPLSSHRNQNEKFPASLDTSSQPIVANPTDFPCIGRIILVEVLHDLDYLHRPSPEAETGWGCVLLPHA